MAERGGGWSASDARMGGGASVSASSSRNSPLFSKCWVRFEISVALLSGRRFWRTAKGKVAWIGRAGTLAEQTETEGGVKVTIHNCPFRNTALKFPQVCTITPHLMSQLLGTAISQVRVP